MPTIAILCGGLATRMRPITETIPKSLIPVAGEPFIGRQLRLLARQGIKSAALCVGHLGEMIQDYVGDGRRFGVEARFSYDGDRPMGTAGALKRAAHLLGEHFLVLYGDSYLECDYAGSWQAFLNSGKDALMTVYRNDDRFDASNIVFRDGEIAAYDKRSQTPDMHYIDYGLGAIRTTVLDDVSDENATDLADVYQMLLANRRLAGFEVSKRFYEIGSPEGLAELEKHVRESGDA